MTQNKQKIISEYMAEIVSKRWKKVPPEERSRLMKEVRSKGKQKKPADYEEENPEAKYAFEVYKKNKHK